MLCVGSCAPLLIQQRIHPGKTFKRSWDEYKYGFGDSKGNYWIGNDVISYLTTNGNYTLKFHLQSRKTGNWYYAEYSTFVVLPEAQNYKLQVAGYSGNAGKDAMYVHNRHMFTTYDRDNDGHSWGNCGAYFGGGFWYNHCLHCGVNSNNLFYWPGLPAHGVLQKSRMWLQCK